MVPELRAEPRTAGRPQPPFRAVDGPGGPPDVGVVMQDPSARAVMRRRDLRAGPADVLDKPDERLHAFAEIGGIRQPVIHLKIDVGRVLAVPRRIDPIVPDALERRRLRSRTRRGNHEIAAVLQVKRRQRRIRALGVCDNAFVGRQVGGRRPPEVDLKAVEETLVVGNVRVANPCPRFSSDFGCASGQSGIGIAAGVVVAAEARRRIDDDQGLVGAFHPQHGAFAPDRAGNRHNACSDREREPPRDSVRVAVLPVPADRVRAGRIRRAGLFGGHRERKGNAAGPIGGQA